MVLWNVFYADWQMECCGTPFAVGDEVSWPLLLLRPDDLPDAAAWRPEFSEIEGPVETRDSMPVVQVPGGPVVALQAAPYGDDGPGSATVVRRGLLSVERHGAEWPPTVGRVRTIHIVTQVYAETRPGSRSYEPVPGERRLRPAEACPKWFGGATAVEPRGRKNPGSGHHRSDTGVLVQLEVPGDAR
ncbi:DUF6578 domain-containing protein [Streptomyces sp. NPDC002004]